MNNNIILKFDKLKEIEGQDKGNFIEIKKQLQLLLILLQYTRTVLQQF